MKRNVPTNSLVCLVMSITFISVQVFGQQGDFFTVTTVPQGLSQGRLAFINNLAQDSMTKSMEYVAFQDLTQQLVQDGALSLKILTEQNRFELIPVHYELQSNGDYTYLGKIDRGEGYAGLIQMQGRLTGFVQSNEGFWEIVPIDDEVSILRELNIAKFQKEICGIDHILNEYTLGEVQKMVDLCDEEGGCGGIIDVLILVPPDVQQWYGTQFGNIWEAVFHTIGSLFSFQLALINSGVEDIALRFRTAPFNFMYSAPLDIETDIFTTLPTSAANIRDEFRADLVVLLTSMDYPGVRGAARAGNIEGGTFTWEAPCVDCAFVISEVQNNVNPTWTLAHEIAHLFGARHNRSNNVPCGTCGDDENICTHGWRFDNGGQDRTIMSILFDDMIGAGSQRALHYSNPDIQFNGFDTGTEDNNNTLGISNATCTIQYYRESAILGVTISGYGTPLCGLNGFVNPRTYTANVNSPATGFPGNPPYTYEWRWNLNGNFTPANPGTLLGTGASVTINSVLGCPQFFLRATVTASDGTTVHDTRVINTYLCTLCQEPNLLIGGGSDFIEPTTPSGKGWGTVGNQYGIAPNPATDHLTITRLNDKGDLFTVRLFDTTGKECLMTKGQGMVNLAIDLSNCPAGMIWVVIQDERGVSVEKIVKAN